MTDLKDRKPALAGSRSFLKSRHFVILVLAIVIYFGYLGSRLVLVLAPEGDREATAISSYPGDRWYISFTHSVEKTAWEEYFTVNGPDDMVMTHTKFSSLGWGYPYSASDGKFSRTEDGRFQLVMNRPYDEVALRVSEQAMQQIVHGNDKYDLVKVYGQGTAVTVKAMHCWQYWLEYYF